MRSFILRSLVIVAFGAAGCPARNGDDLSTARALIACEEPRPVVCTHSYEPVCAVPDRSTRSGRQRTYDNDCTACFDDAVRAYRIGSCEEIAPRHG